MADVPGNEIDAYLDALEEPKRSTLTRLRDTIMAIVPDADQGISYGMPAFRLRGKTVAGFAAFRVVEHDPMQLPAARAAGVRAAGAPVVFVGETHTYPHERWAEALIAAHEHAWTAVTPGSAPAPARARPRARADRAGTSDRRIGRGRRTPSG